MPQNAPERATSDRCPGVLRLHQAADGALARIRLPGGVITADQLLALADAAEIHGDGLVELTSRGNLQLRGLASPAPPALVERLIDTGLLPSLTHENIRNILASPLSGVDGQGVADVSAVPAAVDLLICASAELADLSGRFLFGVDDGRGDIIGLGPDVAVRAIDHQRAVLVLAGHDTGRTVALADAAALLVAAAQAFRAERAAASSATGDPAGGGLAAPGAWRIGDLPDGAARVATRLGTSLVAGAALSRPPGPPAYGLSGRRVLVCGAPLGRLTGAQLRLLAGAGRVVITPWRSVVLIDLPDPADFQQRAARVGLLVAADAPGAGVSACAGQPGCAKSLADVRTDAAALFAAASRTALSVHWVGCVRRCGRPAGPAVEVLATEAGYQVSGPGRTLGTAPAGPQLAALIGSARAAVRHERQT